MNEEKVKITIGLKKASTLLSRIIKMLEGDKYCIDIIQQVLAVKGLLRSANIKIMENHLHTCVKDAIVANDKDELNKKMEELLKVIKIAHSK